ncbi:lantibiotic dehydratase [Saccharopolyspora sp. 5N708]|uniref:lantibiotic dehydratase n=1 Tax=Saccharopolyspora sp. 5N708 TaxID=3457424 RepID=UPI003FD100EF
MSYRVEPTFVVRVAGLPLSALARLRTGRTAELVAEILDAEQWLTGQQDTLSDALHGIVGRTADTGLRRRLIALRRDVYQGRPPRPDIDAELLARLPAGLAESLAEWHRCIRDRGALVSRADAELAAETARQRHALHDIASDPAFRSGLVLASRDLYLSLAKWVPSRPDRKLERKLAKYLSRMAAKTSPYSTFTGSAQGRWVSDGQHPRCSTGSRRSVVELNAFTQQQIPRALSGWPEIRPQLPVAVNSSVVEDGEVIRFLGRKDGEAIIELPNTPTLRRFLAQIRHGADRTFGGVVRALAGLEQADRSAEIAGFLDRLVDIGLVEIGFAIPDNEPDQLGRLAGELERFEGERVGSVRDSLTRLRDDLDTYGRLDEPGERLAQSTAVTNRLKDVYDQLGWDSTGEEFPSNAFYEDVLIAGSVPVGPLESRRGLFDELEVVRRLAGLYDRFLPGRIAAEAFFADHYGVGAQTPFLDFYGAFCKEMGRPARSGSRVSGADLVTCFEQALPVPRVGLAGLDQLAELQEQLVALVADVPVDDVPVDGVAVRQVAPERIREFLDRLPGFVRPIESMTCYLQPFATTDGRPRAVLNELMTGFGRSQARLLRLAQKSGTAAFTPPEPARPSPGGRQYVEVTGTVGSNLNLKHPMTHYEISYPMSTSDRPPDQRIALSDLQVVHDPGAQQLRLVSKSRGIEIMPVHLGMMVEFLLPPAYRFLIQMFGQAVPRFEFVKQLATASPSGDQDGVRRYPRLNFGDLVVNRGSWVVRAADLPRRSSSGSALDHLIEVNRWRRRHRIPQQCFVRAMAGQGNAAQRSRVDGLFDKTRKPVYLDFSSELFLNVFEEVAAGTDQLLVFEEMLPKQEDLVLRDGDVGYAAEFVVELAEDGRDG